jgi:hypothetical protein
MDLAYNGTWGYHPLIVSLAGTAEPLYLVNRPGSRPSHEGAAACLDRAIALCVRAGFRRITLRGDTDFSQTKHLDGWDRPGIRFVFGLDAMPNLVAIADDLPQAAYRPLDRGPRYEIRTRPRKRPENVKQQIVVERGFKDIRLVSEDVAEFDYRPGACKRPYRVVVIRKNLSVERGEKRLFDDIRYFFYITNDGTTPAAEIVALANGRCDQENLIAQLKTGVKALAMPVGDLVSNAAYMVMAALAWTLKAWAALVLPEAGRWASKRRAEKQALLRMEFATFVAAMVRLPCQIVRGARRIVYRLLSWNPWQGVILRLVDRLHGRRRC